jgi:hypothetical protein
MGAWEAVTGNLPWRSYNQLVPTTGDLRARITRSSRRGSIGNARPMEKIEGTERANIAEPVHGPRTRTDGPPCIELTDGTQAVRDQEASPRAARVMRVLTPSTARSPETNKRVAAPDTSYA